MGMLTWALVGRLTWTPASNPRGSSESQRLPCPAPVSSGKGRKATGPGSLRGRVLAEPGRQRRGRRLLPSQALFLSMRGWPQALPSPRVGLGPSPHTQMCGFGPLGGDGAGRGPGSG